MQSTLTPFTGRLLGGLLAAWLATTAATAADVEAARSVFNKTKDAIVSVNAVLKVEFGGRSQDQEVETTGTIISPDGLMVASATTLNPASALMENLESRLGDEATAQGKPKIELSDIKYRLPDGTEIPARVVFKDKDLDVAFLAPDLKEGEKAPQFNTVNVQSGATVKELDEIVSVTRLAKNMSYTPAVMLGNVVAVVTKPRTVYDFAMQGTPTTGCPVFTGKGELVGFTLVHRDVAGRGMMGAEIIIMPASEISGLMDQARKAAAKKPEKSDDNGAKKDKE
jgi:S1-C subfamily serine protease